jgi:hypothetical protein
MNNTSLEEYMRLFNTSLSLKNYTQLLQLEVNFYNTYIKKVESVDHYNHGFKALSPSMINYAESVIDEITIERFPSEKKICFFIASLDNDLAHIEVLSEILDNHNQNIFPEIYIAGHSENTEIKSLLLKKLAAENKIKIINIQLHHESLIAFVNFFIRNNFSKLLVYSIPLHLDFFIKLLGVKCVYWISSRFELNCFDNLKYKISFNNEKKNEEKDSWLRIPASLPKNYKYNRPINLPSRIVHALTIGRPEKIAHPNFMNCIKDILLKHKNVHFSYASNRKCDVFEKYISSFELNNRVSFLGWVEPVVAINQFDVYLDTPQSGLIAAGVFAAGMPIVFYRNSNSFLEAYEKSISRLSIKEDSNFIFKILNLLSKDNNEYMNNFEQILISNIEFFYLQKKIGDKFFYDSSRVYRSLLNIINEE